MTVLVTGGAGYIGSHVAYRLVDAGYNIFVIDDLSSGRAEDLPPHVRLVTGTIANGDLVRQVIREHHVDTVIHLAGSGNVEESVNDPLRYYENNLSATIALLQACGLEKIRRFIFSSTAAVYGATELYQIPETAPTNPVNPYGRSKLMCERAIADIASATKMQTMILRFFNVAGCHPQFRTGPRKQSASHLIKVAAQVAVGRRPYLPIFGDDYPTADGTCVRDFIHVWDLAALHLQALKYWPQDKPIVVLNCGYGRGSSVKEVVSAFERLVGRPIPTSVESRRPGDVSVAVADAQRIRRLLNWQPELASIEAIAASALNWERKAAE